MRRLFWWIGIVIVGGAAAGLWSSPRTWAGPGQKPGALDANVAVQGRSVEDLPGVRDFLSDVAVQPDGRIVAVGTGEPGFADFAVLRYLADGTPDPSFGGGDGKVTTDFIQGLGSHDFCQA